jgi:hypothetical protein
VNDVCLFGLRLFLRLDDLHHEMRTSYIRMGWQSCRYFGGRDSCWSLVDATVYVHIRRLKLCDSGNVLSMLRALGIGASDNHVGGFPACRKPCPISKAGCMSCVDPFHASTTLFLPFPVSRSRRSHLSSRPRPVILSVDGTICPFSRFLDESPLKITRFVFGRPPPNYPIIFCVRLSSPGPPSPSAIVRDPDGVDENHRSTL